MKGNPVHDYILQSERNLQIASAVSEALPEAKEKLVFGFLTRLGSYLIEQLQGWKYAIEGRFFIDQWPCFNVFKPNWGNDYGITLQCWGFGEKMLLGVTRDEKNKSIPPVCGEVLSAVKTLHPSAKSEKWWEAQVTIRSPAGDWRKPDVLWRMHKEKLFLSDVADQLLEIAKISEPVVNRLTRRK